MRPPFSAIEPRTLPVATGTRGEAANASARGSDAGAAVFAFGTCGVAPFGGAAGA